MPDASPCHIWSTKADQTLCSTDLIFVFAKNLVYIIDDIYSDLIENAYYYYYFRFFIFFYFLPRGEGKGWQRIPVLRDELDLY